MLLVPGKVTAMLQDALIVPARTDPPGVPTSKRWHAFVGLGMIATGGIGTVAWTGFLLWMTGEAIGWLLG
jgi:hypothetical protein